MLRLYPSGALTNPKNCLSGSAWKNFTAFLISQRTPSDNLCDVDQVMKAWFMGEIDELFVVDKHPGVRYFGKLENEDQFLQRVLAWFEMRTQYRATLKNGQGPEDAIAKPLTSSEKKELTAADRHRMNAVSCGLPTPFCSHAHHDTP